MKTRAPVTAAAVVLVLLVGVALLYGARAQTAPVAVTSSPAAQSPSAAVDPCAGFKQAVLPTTPTLYSTRTVADLRAGLASDPDYRHTLEDIAGVRQDSNPLRDQAVPRCAVDLLAMGEPVFVRSYPTDAGMWNVPVVFRGRTILNVRVGRSLAGLGTSGGSRGGTYPPVDATSARAALSAPGDPIQSVELVFARSSGRDPQDQSAWRGVRASGVVFYLFVDYPGLVPPGTILPESRVLAAPWPPGSLARTAVFERFSRITSVIRRLDRIDAKLMSRGEFEQASDPGGGSSGPNTDPHQVIWVVAISGEVVPQLGRGLVATWGIYLVRADNGDILGMLAGSSPWPSYLDGLPDREPR